MRRFTKITLSTLNTLFFEFSLKNEHNCQIVDVFKKTNKFSVLLNYTSMVPDTLTLFLLAKNSMFLFCLSLYSTLSSKLCRIQDNNIVFVNKNNV